eukprot:TRINITY_DN1541_c0_g1_i1.p1 TRINITY_DN1541_c0_g1~~TRINITY_DN1541_c0_g1_i1.p1  ORF type:complete len:680 (-),score=61.52 TRINITY_DN1541_c0_g1_i1:70-2109(-)
MGFGLIVALCIVLVVIPDCFGYSEDVALYKRNDLGVQEFATRAYYTGGGTGCIHCSSNEIKASDFACSWGVGNWNEGTTTFADPLPNGYLLLGVELTLYGRFACSLFDSNTTVAITMNGDNVMTGALPTRYLGCICANCVVATTIKNEQSIWLNYRYQHANQIKIKILNENSICMSYIDVQLYAVQATPILEDVSPEYVPLEGGTLLHVVADSFTPIFNYSCVFNDKKVPATILNSTLVTCLAPNMTQAMAMDITIVLNESNFNETGIKKQINYYQQPIIKSIDPAVGFNGSLITVYGSGFFQTPYLSCKFGTIIVPAVYIDQRSIQCTAPLFTGSTVNLTISMNGQQFTSSSVTFNFEMERAEDEETNLIWLYVTGGILVLLTIVSVIFLIVQRRRSMRKGYWSIPSKERLENAMVDISEIVLKERIGRGSVGDVYRGYWRGTEVAIKKMPTVNITQNFMKDMLREAEIMKSLRHPNVLTFMGASTEWPDICIITEYMPKGSLWQVLHDPNVPLSWELLRRMAIDAAIGMNFLHCSNIIHRDLKSHNLLVDNNWKVKVADFGLSKMIEEKCTSTMTACGTPCWTAPEVLRHQTYSIRADVYSFGICLWEMATRSDPYQNVPPFQVILHVATKGLRPQLAPEIPDEWSALIQHCWNDDPERRPTFGEIQETLEKMNLPK